MNYQVKSGNISLKINKEQPVEAAMSFILRIIDRGEVEIEEKITVIDTDTNAQSVFDTDDIFGYLGYGTSSIRLINNKKE